MAEDDTKKGGKKDEKMVQVPQSVLTDIQEKMSEQEQKIANMEARNAGIEEMLEKGATPEGEQKTLRTKKNFEPKFRTVRIRKYPMFGDHENLGYVIGWTSRGAYRKVDDSGVVKQWVDYIDVIYLGHEKDEKTGKLQAEAVKLLDLINFGIQVNCKIVDKKIEKKEQPTGEEISVQTFDPQHGLVATGEIIDGFTSYSDIKYQIQIPGIAEPIWIDQLYCN